MTGPLAGCRVVVCRGVEQSAPLVSLLERDGATAVLLPLIQVEAPTDGGAALRAAVDRLDDFAWVAFTSANAVRATSRALGSRPWPAEVRVAVVGSATGRVATEAGFPVTLTGPGSTGRELAEAFPPPSAPGTVLVPVAEVARPELRAGLGTAGWVVEVVPAYRTVTPNLSPSQVAAVDGADAVVFTAPSTVERFVAVAGRGRLPGIVVVIGPTTAERARDLAIPVTSVADHATDLGLVEALRRCWRRSA